MWHTAFKPEIPCTCGHSHASLSRCKNCSCREHELATPIAAPSEFSEYYGVQPRRKVKTLESTRDYLDDVLTERERMEFDLPGRTVCMLCMGSMSLECPSCQGLPDVCDRCSRGICDCSLRDVTPVSR